MPAVSCNQNNLGSFEFLLERFTPFLGLLIEQTNHLRGCAQFSLTNEGSQLPCCLWEMRILATRFAVP